MVGQGVFEKLRIIAFGVVGPLMRPPAFRSGKRAMGNRLRHVEQRGVGLDVHGKVEA